MKDKSNVYLPSLRSYYDPTNETCVNNPLIKSDASINSCMDDPIVANNIACNEFNYTDEEAENLLQEVQAEIMKKSLAFELGEKK